MFTSWCNFTIDPSMHFNYKSNFSQINMICIAAVTAGASALGPPFFMASWVESPKAKWAPPQPFHVQRLKAGGSGSSSRSKTRKTAAVADSGRRWQLRWHWWAEIHLQSDIRGGSWVASARYVHFQYLFFFFGLPTLIGWLSTEN